MTQRSALLHRASVIATLALSACAQTPEMSEGPSGGSPLELGTTTQAIIGGELAPGAELAAVGAIVYYLPEVGVLDTFCSGTLIASQAIVTARHCTPSIDLAIQSGLVPAFAIGPDAFNPTQVVPITGYVNAPPSPDGQGLLLDGGRDAAVAYLESSPTEVEPAKLGEWDKHNELLGERFTIAGYGINNSDFFYGERYSGKVTARAIKGRWYKLLFDNDYQAYHDWYFSDSAAAQPSEEEAQEWWEIYRLENKFELLAGGLPGEAVGCFGDSGGPLLKLERDGKLTTYGVSFATEATLSTVCGLGGGYLVFNKTILAFIEGAL
jgi:hypothetical protein